MHMRTPWPLLLVLLWGSVAAAAEPTDFATLVDWMSGSFANTAQAEADSNYLDIRLEMKPIWTDRSDGAWLYVEQPLANLGPDDLLERTGCVVYLERSPDSTFTGGTHERDCTSEPRGATWASTGIEIRADGMTSWDRGWNDAGEQGWSVRAEHDLPEREGRKSA